VGVEPVGGPGLERRPQRRRDGGLDSFEVHLPTGHPGDHRHRGSAPEGAAPGGREREDGGPRPPVARRGGWRAVDHLGVQVPRRARHHARLGEPHVVGHLGDPEVDDHRSGSAEHDVAGLEVAVDDADAVDGVQRVGEPVGEGAQLVGGERAVGGHVVLQGGPVDELGDDERLVVLDLGVEDPGHPLPAHPVQEIDLAREPRPRGRIVGDLGVQELQRRRPVLAVTDLVDRAHAAGPDAPHHAVATDLLHGDKPRTPLHGPHRPKCEELHYPSPSRPGPACVRITGNQPAGRVRADT